MLHYANQDVTTVEAGVICHGVNCQGKMGSGVAKAIRAKWPSVYEAFLKMGSGADLLGEVDLVGVNNDGSLFVANCYTQVSYGSDGRRYADPEAIRQALTSVAVFADMRWMVGNPLHVYLPEIGAGLGGLDWDTEVKPIVEKIASNWPNVEFTVCRI